MPAPIVGRLPELIWRTPPRRPVARRPVLLVLLPIRSPSRLRARVDDASASWPGGRAGRPTRRTGPAATSRDSPAPDTVSAASHHWCCPAGPSPVGWARCPRDAERRAPARVPWQERTRQTHRSGRAGPLPCVAAQLHLHLTSPRGHLR